MDFKLVSKILISISTTISLLPLAISLYNYKLLKPNLIPLFILLIASVIIESSSFALSTHNYSSSLLYFFYTLIEFILLNWFYQKFFTPYGKTKIFIINLIAFLLLCFIYLMFQNVRNTNHFSMILESILMTFYSLLLFYVILKNLLYQNLLKEPIFWINTAILFYFSGNLILFVFRSYILHHYSEKFSFLWGSIHSFFNILMNVFFSIGFWKLRAK